MCTVQIVKFAGRMQWNLKCLQWKDAMEVCNGSMQWKYCMVETDNNLPCSPFERAT